MKLEQAVEQGKRVLDYGTPCWMPKSLKALKILIAAGEYVLSQYDPDHQMMRRLLPGETKE